MSRVVVHLDCDCFYAQVELLRLGLPPETPLCVVQWGSALAVSYAARPFGIKRGDRVADIDRKSAGAVTVVSVETIGSEGDEAAAAAPPDVPPGAAPGAAPDATAPDATAPDATAPDDGALPTDARNTEKVSLARYRNASAAVFDVIASMLPPSVAFERASIDEVFLDISAEVDTRMRRRRRRAAGLAALDTAPDLPADTLLMDGGARDAGAAGDRFLYEGALFAAELRGAVLAQSGYTMSAGVAQNKMLAKYASACNKPNKQTVMLPAAVESLLARVPITAFRGCGGKIGNTVAELGFATAAEVRDGMTLGALQAAVGTRHATFIWGVCRGQDDSQVIRRREAKTLLAAKSFDRSLRVDVAVSWLRILARELVDRLAYEEEYHRRYARTLTCTYRLLGCATNAVTTISRTHAMPSENVHSRADALVAIAHGLLVKALEGGAEYRLPINFVGLTGSNFASRASGKVCPVVLHRVSPRLRLSGQTNRGRLAVVHCELSGAEGAGGRPFARAGYWQRPAGRRQAVGRGRRRKLQADRVVLQHANRRR